jgi:hypothetical protein
MCKEREEVEERGIDLRGWRYAAYLLHELDQARRNREIRRAGAESEPPNSEPRKKLLSSADLPDIEKGRNGSEG